MKSFVRKWRRQLALLNYRRGYYLARLIPSRPPATPLHYVPTGFTVTNIAETGIRVVDNFCTAEEANYLIEKARSTLNAGSVIENDPAVLDSGRISSHAVAFHRRHQDRKVLPIIVRGAMLAGVPVDNAEQIYVSRYADGELCNGHFDFSDGFLPDHRLCTMLVYLNDLDDDQGGATYFRDLNLAVKPKAGRAVIWTNMNPDGSKHMETVHAALPPRGKNVEKWVIQLSFRPYAMNPINEPIEPLQVSPGVPLTGGEPLPEGTWVPKPAAH